MYVCPSVVIFHLTWSSVYLSVIIFPLHMIICVTVWSYFSPHMIRLCLTVLFFHLTWFVFVSVCAYFFTSHDRVCPSDLIFTSHDRLYVRMCLFFISHDCLCVRLCLFFTSHDGLCVRLCLFFTSHDKLCPSVFISSHVSHLFLSCDSMLTCTQGSLLRDGDGENFCRNVCFE